MSSPSCAALLVIVTCAVLQALGLSLQLRTDSSGACLQQRRQELLCVAWSPPVETPARAG